MKRISLILIPLLFLALCAGCAKTRKAGGQMDTPEVHYEQGIKYYNNNDFKKAGDEFELARSLDRKYAPCYAGLALVEAQNGKAATDPDLKEKAFDKAEDYIEKAKDLNGKLPAAFIAHGMIITLQHMGDEDKDWVEDAIRQYNKVIEKLDPNNSEAWYRKGWTLKY
ncbi:MAG: hypothetical protein V1913_03630, partial [Fibrobacterota bacterium]